MPEQSVVNRAEPRPDIAPADYIAEFQAYPDDPFNQSMRRLQVDMFEAVYGEQSGPLLEAYFVSPGSEPQTLARQQAKRPLLPLDQFPQVTSAVMELIHEGGEVYRDGFNQHRIWQTAKLVNLLACSDDPTAHAALTDFITEKTYSPADLYYRSSLMETLINAATMYYSPDSNPFVQQDLLNIHAHFSSAGQRSGIIEGVFRRSSIPFLEELAREEAGKRLSAISTREDFLVHILTVWEFEGAEIYDSHISRFFDEGFEPITAIIRKHLLTGELNRPLRPTTDLILEVARQLIIGTAQAKDELHLWRLLETIVPLLVTDPKIVDHNPDTLLDLVDPSRPAEWRNYIINNLLSPFPEFIDYEQAADFLSGLLIKILEQDHTGDFIHHLHVINSELGFLPSHLVGHKFAPALNHLKAIVDSYKSASLPDRHLNYAKFHVARRLVRTLSWSD